MKQARSIRHILPGTMTMEGAGVRLKRLFGNNEVPLFDPFLLLDDFHSKNPADYRKGFPWHPHRGIETITYVLEGKVAHGDSLGNSGIISSGDVQWMTAGSGIIHEEMPSGDTDNLLAGLQLWANLPAAHKMTDPFYQEINRSQIPVIHVTNKVTLRIIAGTFDGRHGPVNNKFIDPVYLDVEVAPGGEFVYPTTFGHTFFTYLLKGTGTFGTLSADCKTNDVIPVMPEPDSFLQLPEGCVALFSEGDFISVATTDKPVRFLLIGGRPLGEPVAWYGPIVMNTDKQLKTAFEEFQVGTFLKHPKPV